MNLIKKISQFSMITLLLIQLVIGTPFTNSIADEIAEQITPIDTIEPNQNTIGVESTTQVFPVTEVEIQEDSTTITYTENYTEGENISTGSIEQSALPNENDIILSSGLISSGLTLSGEQDIANENTTSISGNMNSDSESTISGAKDEIKDQEISIITLQPTKSLITLSGLIDVLSIDSFNVKDNNNDITYCSYITYLNLKNITSLSDDMFIRGNAIDIWTNLTLQSTLQGTGELIFTGTNLSGETLMNHLSGLYTTSGSSVFDIVTFKPKTQDDQSVGLSLHQSHRFVIFLGNDYQRYVLDPVRTISTDPILLEIYLSQHIFINEDIKIVTGYNISGEEYKTIQDTNIKEENITINTGGIIVHSPMEFLPYVLQGLITSTKTGELISNEIIFHTGFRYETISGDLSAYIPAGLIITTANGENFNVSSLRINELSGADSMISSGSEYTSSFKFGIPGQHLIFSHPVQLTIETPDREEGEILELLVQHEGQDWTKQGLTNNPDAICNSDGSVNKEDQGFISTVKNSKIKFYTCGASSFTMNSVGGIAGSNDLRIIIGDYGQIQVYYNGLTQIYGGNPPAAGGASAPTWPILRVGSTNIGAGSTAWTSASTTGSQIGNTYTAKTTLSYTTAGLTYQVIIDWSYIAPDKKFTQSYTWIIPTGNTQNIRWYYGMDSFVAGADANDVGYYTGGTNPTIGIYDNVAKILLGQRYISGRMWSGHIATNYSTVNSQTYGGANYTSVVTTTPGDLGFGANRFFGTTAGTYNATIERPMKPHVTANVPDLIPGIGQPQGNLIVGSISQIPITLTNVGNLTSSGNHQIILNIPTNITGPTSPFTHNGWNCGAQIGTTVTCLKTTTIGPNSGDFVNIPVIPVSAANGSTPTFSTTITNSGDSNTTNNNASVITLVPVTLNSFSSNARLWLKADSLTSLSDGSTVSVWNNFGSRSHATQATVATRPIIRKKTVSNLIDNINFNPVVEFNGSSQYMIVTGGLLAATTRGDAYVYIVSSSTPTNQFAFFENTANAGSPRFSAHLPWSDNNIYRDAGDGATSRLFSTRGGINNKPHMRTLSKSTTNTAQNVKQDIRRNGFTLATSTTTNAIIGNNSQFFLGSNSTPTNYFTGKIAEILVYAGNGGIINKPQQNKIESYLSVKYGITLDQSIAGGQNYILNNNTISWSTGSAGVYNKDIAGITRDDSIGLLQTKSQSINNTEDIIVQKTGLINNNQTLLRGNDGASTSSRTTTELPSGIIGTSRIAREWKFQEKNTDISNVVITYPINTSTLGAGIMSILIDTDGNFTNGGTTEYTGSIVSGHWTFSVNIPDNNVITFAFKKDTYTPGCVNREPWAWYKADDNNYSSISWTDQTTNHRDLDSNGTFFNDPYKTLVNFNPSYDFDSSNYFYYKGDTFSHDSDRGSMRYSVASYQKPVDQFGYLINFTVAGGATENASLLADNNVGKYHSYDTDNAGTTIDVFGTDPFKPKRRVLTSQRFKDDVAISEDGKELDRQSNGLNGSYYNHLSIGIQHDAGGGWKFPWFGQTPEVVLYNDKNPEIDTYNINGDDDERIQTYLAIKYGQTLLHNYIDGYSNTIYDINLGYSNNIFGLGREACEGLYQKQSKSENNNSLVTMFVGSGIADFNEINTGIISNDNSYLIAGDNAGSYDSWSIYGAISGYTMINRKRQTQNSNFIDTIGISVPGHLSSVTNKLAEPITGIVNLIIDNDGDFTDGNSTIYPMTLVGTDWTITGVSLTGVKYYTFASNRIKGDVCIEGPNTFTIGSGIAKSITRQLQAQSNYFKVDDQKGNLSGYYTTLSVSSLTGSNGASIPTSAIQIKADPVTTLSGTYNSSVFVNPTITSYVSAASPVQFLKRNINTGPYTLGTYGSKLWMKINIPAYQSVGTYTGTITYTLYEN